MAMRPSKALTGRQLVALIRLSGRSDAAWVEAEAVAAARDTDAFRVAHVPLSDAIRTYERRLGRSGFDPRRVKGSESLIADLSTADGDELAAIAIAHEGAIVGIWLTADEERVVACFVGPDARGESDE